MRWKTLPLMLLSAVSIAGAQDLPRVIDSPLAGTVGPEFNDASGAEFSPNGARILVTQGSSVSLLDSNSLRTIWNRHFTGNLQAGFSNDSAGIYVYNSTNGQVIEVDPANGAVKRLVGSYDAGRTLRVGASYFALFSVSDVDTTIARFHNLSNGAFVREWSDERVELLTGNKGFAGSGAGEYFYSRRSRIKVVDGTIEKYRTDAPAVHGMYLGGDELGNTAQAIFTRSGENNGAFQNIRVVRLDNTVLNLPAPAAGETHSFAGFFVQGTTRFATVLSQKVVSSVPTATVLRYNIATGALGGSQVLSQAVAGAYAASHVPFGRKMGSNNGRMMTFRPDAVGTTSLGAFFATTAASQRTGEVIGSIGSLAVTNASVLYSSWTPVGAAKREGLVAIPRKYKAASWDKLQPGTWTTAGIPSAIDGSPSNVSFAQIVFGKTGAVDGLETYALYTGAKIARQDGSYSSLSYLTDTDIFVQRAAGNKIDLLRQSGAGFTTLVTIDDSSQFPLAAGGGKLAVVNFTASRKDVVVYDAAGVPATIPITTQPIRVEIGADKVLTLVSFSGADQIKVERYNVAPAVPALLTTGNVTFPYSSAANVRAAIASGNPVLALYAPNVGATSNFGQVKSTLKMFRLPDLLPIGTFTDNLPASLTGLELSPDAAITYAGYGHNAPGFITTAWVSKLTAPGTLGGGDSSTLTVQLPFRTLEPYTVTLGASAGLTLQPSVVVPAGEYQVTVPLGVEQTNTSSTKTVTATLNGINTTLNISVVPPRPSSVVLTPNVVKGGTSSTATVNIIGVAPAGGLTVNLASNNANAQVPATVVVPAGAKMVDFTVTTNAVATTINAAAISATANGATSTANLKVEAPKVIAFTLNSASVIGGEKVKGVVTIDGPAPVGGLTVNITSSLGTAVAANTIVIPAGATMASKSLMTMPVYPDKDVTLTATYQASSVAKTVQVKAARVVSAIIAPGRGDAGDTVTAYILLSGPAAASYPLSITINGVTTTIPVTAGSNLVTFNFTVPAVPAGTYTVSIGNALGGVTTSFEVTD